MWHESAVRVKDRGKIDTTFMTRVASLIPSQAFEVTVKIGHRVWEFSFLHLLEKVLLLDRILVMPE